MSMLTSSGPKIFHFEQFANVRLGRDTASCNRGAMLPNGDQQRFVDIGVLLAVTQIHFYGSCHNVIE